MLSLPIQKRGIAGIYIHFPYCIHKCAYCDFYSVGIGKENNDDHFLFETYIKEISKRKKENSELDKLKFDTIFFGGGTPSLANPENLRQLILLLKNEFSISENAELNLEANPEDINLSNLQTWKEIGFHRINVGVQSFQSKHLQTLDRFHNTEKYEGILNELSKGIIPRFGIDLIYGIPGQTKKEFFSDLERAISYKVNHISAYSLTVEKGTNYSRGISEKKMFPPNEDLQTELLTEIPDFLENYGFHHYEVSNFSTPQNISQHNLKYWTMEYYLGIGPGAHGFLPKGRYANPRSIESYFKENFPGAHGKIFTLDEIALCIFRLFLPIQLESFINLSENSLQKFIPILENWQHRGLCSWDGNIFQWNRQAIHRLDDLILEFTQT